MITKKNYNVDFASLQVKKLLYEFAKQMHFDIRAPGNTRDRTLIKLLKLPSLMVSASSVSKTIILPSNLNELCDRLKLFSQENQAGNISELNKDEFIALVDKLLQDPCISKKQHKQLLFKCNLLHEQV